MSTIAEKKRGDQLISREWNEVATAALGLESKGGRRGDTGNLNNLFLVRLLDDAGDDAGILPPGETPHTDERYWVTNALPYQTSSGPSDLPDIGDAGLYPFVVTATNLAEYGLGTHTLQPHTIAMVRRMHEPDGFPRYVFYATASLVFPIIITQVVGVDFPKEYMAQRVAADGTPFGEEFPAHNKAEDHYPPALIVAPYGVAEIAVDEIVDAARWDLVDERFVFTEFRLSVTEPCPTT